MEGRKISKEEIEEIFEVHSASHGATLHKNNDYWALHDGWNGKITLIRDRADIERLTNLGY